MWQVPPRTLRLKSDEIHVWRAQLDVEPSRVQVLRPLLSADEQVRAGRFHFQKDRQRFIMSRALLRVILSRYLAQEPGQLRFRYNAYGKPALAAARAESALNFNISHSCGLALYAVVWGQPIGIDLERICNNFAYEPLVEHFFSNRETVALRAIVDSEARLQAFFRGWTRKEAYIKAKGKGLAIPLKSFDVSLAPGEPVLFLRADEGPWSLYDIIPAPGYVATLVVAGADYELVRWECIP